MQKIKRVLCALLTAALMLSLTACGQQPDTTTPPSSTDDSTSTTAPAETAAPEGMKIDLTDGWTVGFESSGPFSEDGYYYLSSHFLYFMDTANGISVILCAKAGCPHENWEEEEERDACEAYIDNDNALYFSDGYLYYNKYEVDNPNAVNLYRRNADGTAEKKIATLCEAYFSQTTSVNAGGYIPADGMLYYTATIYEIVERDTNDFVLNRREVLLMRLDLKTGKEEEILRLKDSYIKILAARKDALIFFKLDALPHEEMLEMDAEKLDALPAQVQIWTESSGSATTIFEKTDEQCTMLGIYGGKAYYSGRNEYAGIYAYDFATGEHIATSLPENARIINENYWSVDGELNTTIYDFHTGQSVSGDFADWCVYAKEVGEKGFVADFLLETGRTPEGKAIIEREILGYVPFDAMEDGLQESDILVISDTANES